MDIENKIAEVIESSSFEYLAQCYELDQAPSLGAMVKTKGDSGEIYGVVYCAETHGLELGRRAMARGKNLETSEEIFKSNPQLSKLFITDFRVLVIGYCQQNDFHQYLPPKPAPIHNFIYNCQPAEVKAFTDSLDFLALIANASISTSVDEVLAACLRHASRSYADSRAFLIKAGKELAWLLGNDINRLNSILKRLK
jgi:hypothetical protein